MRHEKENEKPTSTDILENGLLHLMDIQPWYHNYR